MKKRALESHYNNNNNNNNKYKHKTTIYIKVEKEQSILLTKTTKQKREFSNLKLMNHQHNKAMNIYLIILTEKQHSEIYYKMINHNNSVLRTNNKEIYWMI